jgi:putative DNA primase/helicase
VCWRYEAEPNTTKPRKVPYYALTNSRRCGKQGAAQDRAQLLDFDTALSAKARGDFDGVGLALMPEFGVVALDFDDCVVDGVVNPDVASLVAGTYAEYSPSGNGVRAFMLGKLPNKKSLATGGRFGFETFHSTGFVTVTGNALEGSQNTLASITPAVQALFDARFGQHDSTPVASDFSRAMALRDVTAATVADLRAALLEGMDAKRAEAYGDWINIGQALKSLDHSPYADQARVLWHEFSSRSAQYDEYQADVKWDGFAPNKITYRSIFQLAQQDGWINPRSADALKSGDAQDYARLVDRTDTGNANLLANITDGNLRFVPDLRLWLWWDGSRWLADEHGTATHAAALRVAQHYHAEAADLKERAGRAGLSDEDRKRIASTSTSVEKWATHCRNKRAIDAMLSLASHAPALTVRSEELDRDPWLFGVANGVVDLRTGQLRAVARDEFVTKRASVAFDPEAPAPRWRQFIDEITGTPLPVEYDAYGRLRLETVGCFQPRPTLAAYVQRMLGYALTGSTAEQKMFLAIGAGSNGKNALLDIVQEIVGDYCRTLDPAFLMASRGEADAERPTSTAAGLAGARLAISSESKDGQRLDAGLVKRHTGGGFLTARFMQKNTFRFAITHKLVLMTNHTPSLDHLDTAMRGRLHLIPFERAWNRPGHPERDEALPDGDKDLMQRLRAENQGVLSWLVQGAVDYARCGLTPPPEVMRMTRTYFAEQDPVSRWLEQHDRCDPKHGMSAAELFKAFSLWHRDEDDGGGKAPETEKAFSQALATRGIPKAKTKTSNRYGLKPKEVEGGG